MPAFDRGCSGYGAGAIRAVVEKMQATETNVSQPAVPSRTISTLPRSRTDASKQIVELALACAREMRSSGSKPDVGTSARVASCGRRRRNESIPAFMRLSALKLHYADASFISRLGLTGRGSRRSPAGPCRRSRRASRGSLRTNPATSNRQYPSLCLPRFPFLQLTPLTSRANETPYERLPSLCSRRLRRVQR